ncbi:MAG: SDR family oxidoreductase [Spirulina sp. SIO3F2]|nr:SDR family oxidoreductase [Spirulina sp. SIO3F2]
MLNNLSQSFNLENRNAIVTGGGGLLGIKHCLALAELGATVIIADIDTKAASDAAQRVNNISQQICAYSLSLDVTDSSSVEAALEKILLEHGGLHILVNNAAINPKVSSDGVTETSRFENFSLEQWNQQINVGLTGAFLCSKIFGTWMSENGGGIILNIASDLSVLAPDQRLYRQPGLPPELQPVKPVAYSVVKTALIGLTRYLATYWADKEIRVNALSPGGVYNNQPQDFVERLSTLIPMGRMAKEDEYRSAVQFLCSDASSYMTGQNIVMDGGRSVW